MQCDQRVWAKECKEIKEFRERGMQRDQRVCAVKDVDKEKTLCENECEKYKTLR